MGSTELNVSPLVAGLPIFSRGPEELVRTVVKTAHEGHPLSVHFICANSVWAAERDYGFRQLLLSGGLLAPDGRWLKFVSRLSRSTVIQTRGPEMFRRVLGETESTGVTHFFVGPNEFVNQALGVSLSEQFPGLKIGGWATAPFAPFTEEAIDLLADSLRGEDPSIVWLGIGTPAQDVLAAELASRIHSVVMAVGAAFEFMAGLKPEAPAWISRIGFEWLYRFVSEPRRLWKRYIIGNTVFIYAVVKYGLKEKFRDRTKEP